LSVSKKGEKIKEAVSYVKILSFLLFVSKPRSKHRLNQFTGGLMKWVCYTLYISAFFLSKNGAYTA